MLPCSDLAAAAHHFETLGFTVGRRNRHPWGTENHIIQFPGAFLELVALAPDYVPLDAADDAFPFAGFLAGQGGSTDPSGMIVLRSADAAADAARFRQGGFGSGRMLHFARSGEAPDGTTRTVAFTLAFAELSGAPDLGAFVCQQLYPENFWNAAVQRHANGAAGIAEVIVEAAEPDEVAGSLARLALQPVVERQARRKVIQLAEATRLTIRTAGGTPRLAAIRFAGPVSVVRRSGSLSLLFGPAAGA